MTAQFAAYWRFRKTGRHDLTPPLCSPTSPPALPGCRHRTATRKGSTSRRAISSRRCAGSRPICDRCRDRGRHGPAQGTLSAPCREVRRRHPRPRSPPPTVPPRPVPAPGTHPRAPQPLFADDPIAGSFVRWLILTAASELSLRDVRKAAGVSRFAGLCLAARLVDAKILQPVKHPPAGGGRGRPRVRWRVDGARLA